MKNRKKSRLSDLFLLAGLALVLLGIARIYVPAALIAGGLACMLAALVPLAPKKPETTD